MNFNNSDHWSHMITAVILLLTYPLWKPKDRDMMSCRDFKPLPPGVSPCATEDQLHRARMERWEKIHGGQQTD